MTPLTVCYVLTYKSLLLITRMVSSKLKSSFLSYYTNSEIMKLQVILTYKLKQTGLKYVTVLINEL